MKIFFPLEVFYPSQAGGPANSIYWLTKHLSKYDLNPTIVATDRGIDRSETQLNKWVKGEFGKAKYIKTFTSNIPFSQMISSLIEIKNNDVIHLSSVFFPTAFLVGLFAKLKKKKIILSPRGELDSIALTYSRYKKIPVLWVTKTILGKSPTFHSTCEAESEYIKNIFGAGVKIVQIPNFIEMPNKAERSTTEDYLLFIGRLYIKKGLVNLIEALSLSDEFLSSDFKLKVAGVGDSDYIRKAKLLMKDLKLENRVEFIGQIEGIEKQELYANAYFTFMPSYTENFGNVVLESLAQNTPVVASIGTPWKILEDEKVGFWVDNSAITLAKTITKILSLDKNLYQEYRSNSRKFVKEKFEIKANIHKWVEVYKDLM